MLPSLRELVKLEVDKNKSLTEVSALLKNAVEIVSIENVSYESFNTKIVAIVDQWRTVDPLERPDQQFIERVGFYNRLDLSNLLFGVGCIQDSINTIISSLNQQGYDFNYDDLELINQRVYAKEKSLGYVGSILLSEIGVYTPPVIVLPPSPAIVLSVGSDSKPEGSTLTHEIILNKAAISATGIIVAVAFNGSAVMGVDTGVVQYNVGLGWVSSGVSSGSFAVVVPTGSDRFSIRVPTVNDTYYETNETYTVSAKAINQNPVFGTGTILNNDPVPVISINDTSVTEGGLIEHTVTLSTPSASVSSYPASLVGITATNTLDFNANLAQATLTNGVTYNPANQTLVIPALVTSFKVSYTTVDDNVNESVETVEFRLGNKVAIGTIFDNDTLPSISVNNIEVTESVDSHAVFNVTLSHPMSTNVQFTAMVINGSAVMGQDIRDLMYQNGAVWVNASNTPITIPAGETTARVRVTIDDDNVFEPNKSFTLAVTVVGNVLANEIANGLCVITSNDPAPTVTYIGLDSKTEGDRLLHPVTLSNPSSTVTNVQFQITSNDMNLSTDISSVEYSLNNLTWLPLNMSNFGFTVPVPANVTNFAIRVNTVDNFIDQAAVRSYTISAAANGQTPLTTTGSLADNDIFIDPGTGTPSDPYVINDFDYAVVRYIWTAEAGRDLDTRTWFNTPNRIANVVGWAKSSTDADLLKWGGDNVQSGVECILVDMKAASLLLPNQQNFEIFANAFWYSEILTGDISIQFQSYKGGTMAQSGFDWVNNGGVVVQNLTVSKNIQNVIGEDRDMGIRAATLNFNVVTKSGTLNSV